MSLSDFRADAAPPAAPKTDSPDLVFNDGTVLSIDQSVTATGWVLLRHDEDGLHCQAKGSVLLPADGYPKGHEGMLLRADVLAEQLDVVMRGIPVTPVVHELPPRTTGARMSRPESSLMGAVVVRTLARDHGHPVTMVDNRHSKKVLVGNSNVDKPGWHKVLERITWDGERPTNEGQRDAFCLGLTYLIENKEI